MEATTDVAFELPLQPTAADILRAVSASCCDIAVQPDSARAVLVGRHEHGGRAKGVPARQAHTAIDQSIAEYDREKLAAAAGDIDASESKLPDDMFNDLVSSVEKDIDAMERQFQVINLKLHRVLVHEKAIKASGTKEQGGEECALAQDLDSPEANPRVPSETRTEKKRSEFKRLCKRMGPEPNAVHRNIKAAVLYDLMCNSLLCAQGLAVGDGHPTDALDKKMVDRVAASALRPLVPWLTSELSDRYQILRHTLEAIRAWFAHQDRKQFRVRLITVWQTAREIVSKAGRDRPSEAVITQAIAACCDPTPSPSRRANRQKVLIVTPATNAANDTANIGRHAQEQCEARPDAMPARMLPLPVDGRSDSAHAVTLLESTGPQAQTRSEGQSAPLDKEWSARDNGDDACMPLPNACGDQVAWSALHAPIGENGSGEGDQLRPLAPSIDWQDQRHQVSGRPMTCFSGENALDVDHSVAITDKRAAPCGAQSTRKRARDPWNDDRLRNDGEENEADSREGEGKVPNGVDDNDDGGEDDDDSFMLPVWEWNDDEDEYQQQQQSTGALVTEYDERIHCESSDAAANGAAIGGTRGESTNRVSARRTAKRSKTSADKNDKDANAVNVAIVEPPPISCVRRTVEVPTAAPPLKDIKEAIDCAEFVIRHADDIKAWGLTGMCSFDMGDSFKYCPDYCYSMVERNIKVISQYWCARRQGRLTTTTGCRVDGPAYVDSIRMLMASNMEAYQSLDWLTYMPSRRHLPVEHGAQDKDANDDRP